MIAFGQRDHTFRGMNIMTCSLESFVQVTDRQNKIDGIPFSLISSSLDIAGISFILFDDQEIVVCYLEPLHQQMRIELKFTITSYVCDKRLG